MRKLASIARIASIQPIAKADRLELASIKGWRCVVGKGQFKEGDLAIYFEIDSVLPVREEFEFLRTRCYSEKEDGFVIRTMKLKGVISQGLLQPLSILGREGEAGEDVTEELGVRLKEDTFNPEIALSSRPHYIPSSSIERVQNVEDLSIFDRNFHVTEKIDGQAAYYSTAYGQQVACSRECNLKPLPSSPHWKYAYTKDIHSQLMENDMSHLVLQGELCGPSIKPNGLCISTLSFFLYSVWDTQSLSYLGREEIEKVAALLGIEIVPLVPITLSDFKGKDDEETLMNLLKAAQGSSLINPSRKREGLVFTFEDGEKIKVISNAYLLAS